MSGLGRDEGTEPEVRGTHNELSGTVGGSAVQIGHVGGDVNVVAGSSALPVTVPHEVPVSLPGFVNREDERSQAGGLLDPDAKGPALIAVFTGLPGVGKTATAQCVVGENEGAYAGGELFVDFARLRDRGGTAVSDGLADCLRALGVDDRVMPPTLAGRANLYRTRTKSTPVLVMLDDVAEPAEVAPFVPTAPGSAVLVTSNRQLSELLLDDAAVVPIDPLHDVAGADLLTALCGKQRQSAEPEALGELAALCGGLPIALRVAAARLRSHPSLRVSDLVAEIASDDSGLSAFELSGAGQVASVFTASYRDLPVGAARLYRRLGLLPGPDFTAELAAALDGGEPAEERRLLGFLVEANLVTDGGTGRYRLHSLVRRHARGCASEDEPEESRATTLRRAVRYLLRYAAFADLAVMGAGRLRITSHEELLAGVPNPFEGENAKVRALDWLDTERPNLMAVLRVAVDQGWHRQAWQLAEAMTALYVNRRYLEDWIESTRLGVTAAQLDQAPEAVARLRSFVSRALTDLGDLTSARAALDESLPIAQESGHRRLEASVWELIGRYHDEQAHESGRAVEAYQRARELFDQAEDKRGSAFVQYFLGRSQDCEAGSEQALHTLQRALELIREVPDQRMAGRALASIGTAHAHLGDYASAVSTLDEAIADLAAGNDIYYEAQAREALAEVAERMGDRALQQENLQRALEIHATFGSPRVHDLQAALARMA
jgi:tetratricopeptide (TPR) repeat protein